MTLDQLNYLIVLAEEQNVTRAAQRLYITQPTLTTYINKLERELGTRLFDRSKNPVKLTKNGEIYLARMRELILAEQQLKDELRYQDSGRKRIRIGIGYTHSAMWAACLAEALFNVCPTLDIQFQEGQEADLMSRLRTGDIDIFFGHAEIDPVTFTFGELFQERIVLMLPKSFLPVIPPDNQPGNPFVIEPEALNGKRMIVPGSLMGLNLNVQLLWKRYGIAPPSVIQTKNMISGVQMVALGLGFMLGNEELVRFLQPEERDRIIYCSLPDMAQTRNYYYGFSESNPERDLIINVIKSLKGLISHSEKPSYI
ncbi:MAG: LysR family transcriptional regulator [Oscillospiraceae bacterium]|nr:LysR family transcriptional regulator [Oscillospiraceae bacterium]